LDQQTRQEEPHDQDTGGRVFREKTPQDKQVENEEASQQSDSGDDEHAQIGGAPADHYGMNQVVYGRKQQTNRGQEQPSVNSRWGDFRVRRRRVAFLNWRLTCRLLVRRFFRGRLPGGEFMTAVLAELGFGGGFFAALRAVFQRQRHLKA
jgi:hypothetical protein